MSLQVDHEYCKRVTLATLARIEEKEAMKDARLEAAARALASIEPGEDWPTNDALGGSLTGTRDDEYRDGMREQAKDAPHAADAFDAEQGVHRLKVDDGAALAIEKILRGFQPSYGGKAREILQAIKKAKP